MNMKKLSTLIIAVILLLLAGCGEMNAAKEDVTLVYEAFFLDNEEILELFCDVRGSEAPYEYLTKDFHVTVTYMPEKDMHEFYGTEATIIIYAYQNGEVIADDGSPTANEGFFCTVETENKNLQQCIDGIEKNWHITGSYMDEDGAKYTEYLDLEGAKMLTYTVKGYFGGGMSDGSVDFSSEE